MGLVEERRIEIEILEEQYGDFEKATSQNKEVAASKRKLSSKSQRCLHGSLNIANISMNTSGPPEWDAVVEASRNLLVSISRLIIGICCHTMNHKMFLIV
ncbi:hypothetical protein ACTXT7_007093 [Hymenolepis weldensis]